ncbi:hypothetical protein Tco_0741180 [Tanacetum coccineum]
MYKTLINPDASRHNPLLSIFNTESLLLPHSFDSVFPHLMQYTETQNQECFTSAVTINPKKVKRAAEYDLNVEWNMFDEMSKRKIRLAGWCGGDA